jgi:hypothetical protein
MRRLRRRDGCRSCWAADACRSSGHGGRTVAGDEIELAYAAFSNDDLLSQVVMEWMLAGW